SDRRTEFPAGSDPAGIACVEVLLAALTATTGTWPGFVGEGAEAAIASPGTEIRSLLVDPHRPGTVAHSVQRLLDAAAEVRDQLSNDTWLVIGHLDRDLADLDGHVPDAAVTGPLGRVMTGMLALSGLSAESMVRDDGWQFMEAGRRLERALQLCALLGATVARRRDDATDGLVIESVLTSAESIVTYRRRYRSHGRVETVLDLLLLDGANPRSLAFQVKRLADAVDAMPPAEPAPTAEIGALLDELGTLVALADTNELARPGDGGLPALTAFLGQVQLLVARLGEELDAAHFSHQLPQRAVVPLQSLGLAAPRRQPGVHR
ncbi:MAG: alpha-E domain-containing protein, partial [Acidimicrobiales bacterium]|nr:alpha-E domain-containing protein [Acidimicrobiales bacterium]